jgi:hypothetical protein
VVFSHMFHFGVRQAGSTISGCALLKSFRNKEARNKYREAGRKGREEIDRRR